MNKKAVMERGMWRFFDRLPLKSAENIVTLGEGGTPLLDLSDSLGAALGIDQLVLKAEDRNPTGSFKARIATVAYSLVRERGLKGTLGTSSGNGGAAAAAYAAASGSRALLFLLAETIPEKLREIQALGGVTTRIADIGFDAKATIDVADRLRDEAIDHDLYPMLTGFSYAPEAMEGVKTVAFELAEEAPDLTDIYVPVGGGGLLTGIYRGYLDMAPNDLPRLVGVHPEEGAALRYALSGDFLPADIAVSTTISGLQMAALYDPEGAVEAITASEGRAVGVPDEGVWDAQRLLAQSSGILVEPAGATAMAGVISDARQSRLGSGSRVGVILTGAGHKDAAALSRLVDQPATSPIQVDEVGAALARLLGT